MRSYYRWIQLRVYRLGKRPAEIDLTAHPVFDARNSDRGRNEACKVHN